MTRRLVGALTRPRSTMAEVVAQPQWALPWLTLLAIWAVCALPFLTSAVGRQALVDEHVRRVESFGGTIDDGRYRALQENPPFGAYLVSGGRMLLTPPVTLAVAMGLILLARRDGAAATLNEALAVSVYASVPLVLGNVAATPWQYVRESLTSPFNLAALLPVADEGTGTARLLGSIELVGLWWTWLLAVGLGTITGRPARRSLAWLLALYLGVAAVMSAVLTMSGGS